MPLAEVRLIILITGAPEHYTFLSFFLSSNTGFVYSKNLLIF